MTWSFISVEEGGRDNSYGLDSVGSSPAAGFMWPLTVRWLKSNFVTKTHLGNGPVVRTKTIFFFPSCFLANAWLQPSTHVGVPAPMGSAFSEPKGRQTGLVL